VQRYKEELKIGNLKSAVICQRSAFSFLAGVDVAFSGLDDSFQRTTVNAQL